MKPVSEKRIITWLNKWVERLYLQAWDIGLEGVPTVKVTGSKVGECNAYIDVCRTSREATITVATLRAWKDIQAATLHELLHLSLAELHEVSRMLFSNVGQEMTELVAEAQRQAEHDLIYMLVDNFLGDPDKPDFVGGSDGD